MLFCCFIYCSFVPALFSFLVIDMDTNDHVARYLYLLCYLCVYIRIYIIKLSGVGQFSLYTCFMRRISCDCDRNTYVYLEYMYWLLCLLYKNIVYLCCFIFIMIQIVSKTIHKHETSYSENKRIAFRPTVYLRKTETYCRKRNLVKQCLKCGKTMLRDSLLSI